MTGLKLYEIAEGYRDAAEDVLTIDEETGEVIIDPEKKDLMARFDEAFERKAEAVAAVREEMLAEVEALKAAVQHQTDAIQIKKNKAEALKQYLYGCMCGAYVRDETGKLKGLSGNLFSIFEHLSKKTVEDSNVNRETIPAAYRRELGWELDKKMAKTDIEDGKNVPGVILIEGRGLTIRKKKRQGVSG